MAKWAVNGGYEAAMTPDDMMTLRLEVNFFDTDAGRLVTESATVRAAIDPTGTPAQWHAAMVDAIVAYAAATFGWTVPRTSVIHPQLAKGLLV